MFNVGYYLAEELMAVAETLEAGKTVKWLKSQAGLHGIYIITSLYERHEGHFYNTMVMVARDGSLQYYRKRNPALSEAAVWRRSPVPGPGIFDTPLGRIGGAICFDSFTRETFEGFKQSAVELAVIVACWGVPPTGQGTARFAAFTPDPAAQPEFSLGGYTLPVRAPARRPGRLCEPGRHHAHPRGGSASLSLAGAAFEIRLSRQLPCSGCPREGIGSCQQHGDRILGGRTGKCTAGGCPA